MALVANMGPGVEFDAPACIPARYGLLSVAEVEDVADGHWLAKFHTELESCDDLEVRAIHCEGDARTEPKLTEGPLDFPESDPFTLVAPFECSTGGMTLSEAWDHAAARLDAGEDRALERTFWTGRDRFLNELGGTLGGDPGALDLTPIAGTASITEGVALLEQWAGENMPCAPTLHASRGLGVYLAERHLIEPSGNVMYSRGTGSRVAIGGGYSSTGPDGVAAPAGEGWLWVTGSIKVLRGPVWFTPDRGDMGAAVDRTINDITVFAERNYGITRGCGLAAVRVTLTSCCA